MLAMIIAIRTREIGRKKKLAPQMPDAVYLLVTNRLGATTGQIIPVDAGLTEAFLR